MLVAGQTVPLANEVALVPAHPTWAGGVDIGVQRCGFRHEAQAFLVLENDLAVPFVAHRELARVPVAPLARGVVGSVTRARRHVGEPWLARGRRAGVAQELQCLVGEIGREMVSVFRASGRIDRVVVIGQIRVPLVGQTAEEPVEAVESARQGPRALRRAHPHLDGGAEVPLAERERVIAAIAQHFGKHAVLARDETGQPGEAVGHLSYRAHAVALRVAAGQQRGAGGRTERRGVELREPHAAFGDTSHRGHLDEAAVEIPCAVSDVVPHDEQHVRRALGRLRLEIWRPVRLGFADVDGDRAIEPCVHGRLLSSAGTHGIRRPPSVAGVRASSS